MTNAVPEVTITLTLRRTNSETISAERSLRPSAQRYTIATVRSSTQPSLRSRCTKAAVHWLANLGSPAAVLEMREVEAAARALNLDVAIPEIRQAEDILPAIEAFEGHAEALYVCIDPLISANRVRINTLALAAGLPTMHSARELVEAAGLMSYGPNIPDMYRRAAEFVDKILHGAKPAEIPVEQPTKFELIINLKTAKALGLEIPPTLLARADEVIE